MMRFKYAFGSILFIVVPFVFISCDNSLEIDKRVSEESTIESYISGKGWSYNKSDGVYHAVITSSYGYQVDWGDTVLISYKGYTLATTPIIFDTNIKSVAIAANLDTNIRSFEPLQLIMGKSKLIEGLERGLLLTRDGEISNIIFTSDLGFKDEWVGPLESWIPLAYYLEIVYVNGKDIQQEKSAISSMDLSDYTLDGNGLYYKYLVDTSVVRPSANDVIYGWYSLSLPDGTLVDEVSASNKEINLSSSDIIGALKVGFTLLSKGGSAKIIAPSPLCYGKDGSEKVKPYQPLVIDIRLDSIKSK